MGPRNSKPSIRQQLLTRAHTCPSAPSPEYWRGLFRSYASASQPIWIEPSAALLPRSPEASGIQEQAGLTDRGDHSDNSRTARTLSLAAGLYGFYLPMSLSVAIRRRLTSTLSPRCGSISSPGSYRTQHVVCNPEGV